jgi:hypothetical protein
VLYSFASGSLRNNATCGHFEILGLAIEVLKDTDELFFKIARHNSSSNKLSLVSRRG